MDMAMIGWIVLGWFAVAIIVSLALGGILRQSQVTHDDLAAAASKRKVMRYLRMPAAKSASARTRPHTLEIRAPGKGAVRAAN